ncbi:MAG: CPBP family intramembrane metalloprotease [Verrucomicrobiales bacterium]|nr:CPBP family intramembrane metalloprotease [Verrucomicrobiales bacterium]
MTVQPHSNRTNAGATAAAGQGGTFSPWPALAAFVVSVASTWSAGAWLQTWRLAPGLLLTELCFFAAPASLVLLCQPWLRAGEVFVAPSLRRLGQTVLLALPVIGLAVGKGLAVREALKIPVPTEPLAWPVALVVAFAAPVCEELLFRPVLQGALSRIWKPSNAILATALLFGLVHGSGVRFGETFLLGLFAGVVFHKTGSYWACVLLHVLSNTLGPALFRQAAMLGWLTSPFVALPLAAVAIWLSGRLGPPAPLDLGGWRAVIGWRLFGGGRLPGPAGGRRGSFVASFWGLAAAMTFLVVLATFQELRERIPPPVPMLEARQSDTWLVREDEMIVCESRIEFTGSAVPPREFRLALPYPEARIARVRLGDADLKWRMTYLDLFEVILPEEVPANALPALEIEWDLPMTALDRDGRGYTARLQALLPVLAYRLDLILPPDSPWQLGSDPALHRTTLFSIEDPGTRPRHFFGTCGIRLRKRLPAQ